MPSGVPEPISKCGDMDVIFEYRAASQKLTVMIVRAQGLPDKDRSGINSWQVHVVLLPSKKQRGRTSIQRGPNPVFKEKVTFTKLEPREMASSAIRFRLYAARKMTRERMMGEKLFYLSHLRPEGEMKVTLVLEPRSNISVSMLNGAMTGVFKDVELSALDLVYSAYESKHVNLIFHLVLLILISHGLHFMLECIFRAIFSINPKSIFPVYFRKWQHNVREGIRKLGEASRPFG